LLLIVTLSLPRFPNTGNWAFDCTDAVFVREIAGGSKRS
jgi:hypothetical protein